MTALFLIRHPLVIREQHIERVTESLGTRYVKRVQRPDPKGESCRAVPDLLGQQDLGEVTRHHLHGVRMVSDPVESAHRLDEPDGAGRHRHTSPVFQELVQLGGVGASGEQRDQGGRVEVDHRSSSSRSASNSSRGDTSNGTS